MGFLYLFSRGGNQLFLFDNLDFLQIYLDLFIQVLLHLILHRCKGETSLILHIHHIEFRHQGHGFL